MHACITNTISFYYINDNKNGIACQSRLSIRKRTDLLIQKAEEIE